MATFRTDYFPPSNRRRCVKGRSSYTDSSDLYLSAAVNQDQNSNGFSQNEDSYIDSVRSDDGEEEDITIDLSAFLNDNPLLAQAAFESASENNIASTESSSQFRVTDCKVDPSEIPKAAVTDPLLSVDVNGDTSVGSNIANENIVGPHAAATFIHNTKENCLSPEKILINVTNNEPAQSVTLNGKKTVLSPTKKFSKALGLSNPLKKYKNFMKSKDLNKVNEKVFGKYPIVKCEKLDIENFVKNNKIKIRNWPLLQTESKKSNSVNKGTIKRKVNLNKGNLKPKFMKKPINFNKYLIASNKDLANQNISNILSDQPDVSKPIIIKTDSWKPGVTNVSSCVPSFFRPLTKTSLSTSKNVACDLLKLNDKTVGLNVISSPEKKCDIRAKSVATNINKLFNSPKSYPLIAPKPCLSSPNIHPITTTKPLIETLTTSVTDNFTVIEPYVDDPTSPQKPKPILTVPVEVVPSPEKQNPVINSSPISSVDIITNANNSEKLLKAEKSVFLNGGIKKIIVPTKTKTDVSISKKEIVHRKINQEKLLKDVHRKINQEKLLKDVHRKINQEKLLKDVHRKINQEKLLKEVVPKVPVVLKVKDVSSEESASVLKAKNIVLDAMQNVFSSTQSKKIPKKSVRSVKKPTCDLTSGNSIIGSSAFSSILNDNILNGFSENDFEDVPLFDDDDSFTDSTQEMSPPSKSLPDKVNVVTEDSGLTPKSIKKARERKKYKRKKSSDNSHEINSTLSASECESEDKLEKDKRAVISHEDNIENIKSSTINISVHSKNFNEPVNKDFETKHVDSSLLFSNFESHISESQDSVSCNKLVSPKIVEQTEIPLSSFNEIVHNVNSPVKKCKENDNLVKQETSTRTLRDRKCSSTEVKNFNNSTKHNPHEKNSPEKNKNKSSINSKLKIQLKSPKNSSKNKLKKKSCKPEDIIQEINTITGGHSVPKRGLPKNKKSDSEKDIKSLDYSNINIQNDSESNSSNVSFSTQPSLCPLSEQKKTLKVCIKRSKRKTAMKCSEMSLNILTDVVDNANISNSVLESNLSLHSSFREAKDEKMGTLQKEENSAVNSSPIPDCNMENSNEKLHQKGQIPVDAPDLMVNSSETPLLEDTSNNINSDINCKLADNILVVENQGNTKELPNDFVNNDDELVNTEKHNFSSVHDFKNSENDLESSESLVKVDNIAILAPLEIGNSKDTTFSSEDDVKNSGNSESLIEENNSADIEVSSYLPNKDSKDTMLSSADEIKNSENDSDSCESLIKENNSTVIGVLPALEVENSKDIPLSVADSVELIDKTNSFSNTNDSNDILNENLHNICDVTFDSTVNQTNENEFEETENTSEGNIAVNPEMSAENEVFEDFVHEETVIEEVVTMEIYDDSEEISGNPDVSICVDDEADKSNLLPSIDSPEESASNPSSTDIIIEEKDIDSSDVPSNDIQIDKNKAEISDTCHQFTKDCKRSVSFPENSSLTEKEALVVEESNNTSSDLTNDISENVSHELNEKCEDFSVSSLLLKSNNEDKITVSEEIADLTDTSSNNLTTENIDNRQFNTISLNLSCSDTTPEKEILNTEISSTNEDQKTGCQVNEASLNVSCVSNETFEAKSDISIMNSDEVFDSKTEKEIMSIEKDSDKNQKSSSIENKKCPKIKLFKKSDADSPDSLKSWFVSENSEKEVKSAISNEAFETKSDNINSLNFDETPDLHISSGLDDNSSVNSENHKSNIEGDSYIGIHNAVLPEKKNSKSSCNFEAGSPSLSNLLSDKNVLTEIEEISSKSHSVEKSNHTEEMSLPNNKVPSENINETASENLLPLDHEEQSKALFREKENYDFPVIIKEEPMDIEENTESSSSYVLEEKSIKTEPLPNKRKRGRPRKSIEYCNTSLDFGDDLVIPKIEKTTVPVIPEVKEEDVTPKREIKITPGAHSAGHKRKSNPVQASTPSSSRKKNYDPELVCLPFSMGWMREHVIRATGKDNRRQSDIYYFSPEGTKLRSMPDILTYLSKHPHIKLSAVNFTFAKELIYREPFEIERDAKQPSAKKICATPTAKKTPSKALISLADSPSDKPSSVESKKKLTLKRKRSSLNESDLLAEDQDTTFSSSNTFKKSKQLSLAELLTGNSNKTEDKPSRPSRRIVKKIPFDPSISSVESQPSKKAKSGTIVTRHSTGNIKKESIERASLIVKIPLKSSSSNITKENELQNSVSATELKKSEVSSIKSKKELSVNKPSNASAKSSMPGKSSESTSTETLLSRTNIKSPKIQNRLKVRLGGQRKTELITMHKPCTKYCNFSQVRIPSVQCTVCLCMFHPECIPFKPAGLTKYACVPCVVTNLGSSNDMSEDLFFADDFDFELLYPSMSLQIVEDPVFNATYNKFYSPVDHSFAHTIGINNARYQRPLQPCSANNVAYYVNKNSLTPLNTSAAMQSPTILYRPAGSFNVRNAPYSVPTPIPIQPAPNVNMQNIRAANLRNSSGVQLKTVAPGSLPLLQNFSNAFFVQNQPFNSTSSSSSINFQNSLQQPTANTQVPLGTFTNADGSKVQRTLFVRKLPNNQQISGLISTGNVQNISDHTKNISVLQTMLQSHPEFSNKSIKLIKFNDYSTLKIAGDNIPTPISINVISETNSSTSSKQTSNITPSEPNCNKIKNDHSSDETMKKPKYSNVLETDTSAEVSSSPHKISNVHSFSEQLSTSWNMNKFAQIYECLNFIFKFLNVSDLLRASLVCRSWNHLATQKLLWDHVSFSGITIKDWVRCCKTLQRHETKCIDFRGLYDQDSDDSWKAFLENILRLTDVEELIFEKVPPYVIKKIADSLPQLRKLTCFCMSSIFTEPEIWSTPCEFELASLRCLGRLEALKISSMGGIHLNDSQLSLLPYLPNLTHLVLSGFKFNSCINLECLSQMTQLITLELGDCKEIEPQIYGLLSQLTNLENLCLQNGGDINDKKLSESLLKINKLKTLELMNFQLSCHVSEALEKMDTLLHFSLWPDNRTKAEQVNFNSFKAATSCPNLKRLCWGILTDDDTVPNNTLELRDSDQNESVVKKMSFQELFQALVKHNPGVKVELKCLPRSIWSEFCSSRNFM